MRILHVIPSIALRYGGPSFVALETCQRLAARGHAVSLATTDADGPGRLDVVVGEPTTYEGLDAIFFPRTRSEAFKWSPGLARWLDARVRDFDIVDIHAIFSHSSLAAGRACRDNGVPYVVRPHGALDPWSLARKAFRKRVLFWLGARRLLTGAASVQYTTNEEQQLAEEALSWLANGVVVPLGVATDPGEVIPQPESPPYVLTLSRLDRKKRLDVVISAFHQVTVAGQLAHWRLVIAGDGGASYVRELKRLAANGPAASRIQFTGWVDGPVKAAWLRGASVLAAPSAQENFGMSVVEAMAVGVPVIVSTRVNLAPAIASAGAGWLAEPQRGSFARVLEAVLRDRAGRLARGREAAVLARDYGWERSLDELVSLYQLVGQGAGLAA
jgi:glycosyltransferase involved in cell wall biosynthesis